MELLKEFFEEFDELVYISDPETHELLYMNRGLRELLGYPQHEQYVGKKCYAVLQGRKEPCPFCTNQQLKMGEFISWTHKNPVLQKRYLIKDSLIQIQNKPCRIELAIDMDSEVMCGVPYYYVRRETVLNECLQRIFSTTDPEQGMELVLAYLGETFGCDRVYIFEIDEDRWIDNTYEWCREGVMAQQEILQRISLSSIDWWMKKFQKNQVLVIQDLEEIRAQYPVSYTILKPQNVTSLAAGPISIEGRVIGFLGVDNPRREIIDMLTPILNVIGYFMAALLRQRNLLKRLNTLSFHDPLTGAYNRNAMFEHNQQLGQLESMGVVYCDITGLKRTNDVMGHDAGDRLIQHCCDVLRETLQTEWLYRTGGDEFVAVFRDCGEKQFQDRVQALRERVSQDQCHMAVGYAWSDQQPFHLELLITQADKVMYQDKRNYYAANYRKPGIDHRNHSEEKNDCLERRDSPFYHFVATTYCDMELLFQSISERNSVGYYYFGDMQKDLFYISDNMRDEFGFQNNVVPGLLREWAKRITTTVFRKLYWQEIQDMLREKRSVHDLRYQVRNASGKNTWIRCYGILKWDEEKNIPLFFAGRVTHQDDAFVVDPVTNFPRESAVFSRLDGIRESRQSCLIIGFSFNNITELNSTRGRTYSDHLVQNIAEELMNTLSGKMSFYRLEGMRCMAVVEPTCQESRDKLVGWIRNIVEAGYRVMGLSVHHPCSFALMEYPQSHRSPADFLEDMVSLIKVAKHDPKQLYVENSEENIRKIKRMSNMALSLTQDVLRGMEHFRIIIQPVVSARNGAVVGGEALLRWTFEGKDVSPAIFIPMLEKENLIQLVGRWVFEQTVCSCMRMAAQIPSFYLTFNVSLRQLSDEHFTDFMKSTMEKYHLDGCHLVAEVTESFMDEQPENLMQFVNACKSMGIQIALDDFGSGYSSLRMLLQYPSSIIKLDRSLLAEMTESADKMNFISSIVYACHRFGKKVCMEGVETDVQNALIRESGCDMIQGYYYYRPMEVEEVYRLLATDAGQSAEEANDK